MDVRHEAVLRVIGLFTSVYFTLGWGEKSKPEWDAPLMIGVIILAVMANYL
jgi:hypothetical protein